MTCRPYLVLLPVGLAVPPLLPETRCALTAPFQPCRSFRLLGGFISVALSLRLPWADVIRHRVSVEPGLSSSSSFEEPAAIRPSDTAENSANAPFFNSSACFSDVYRIFAKTCAASMRLWAGLACSHGNLGFGSMFVLATTPAGPPQDYERMAQELERAASDVENKPSFDRELVERLRNIARALRHKYLEPQSGDV